MTGSTARLMDVILVMFACTFVAPASAHASAPRGLDPQRLGPRSDTEVAAADPANELRKMETDLEAAIRRRAPDWSPEADAVKDRVDGILAAMLDYEGIARRALGTDWNNLTSAQRQDFLRVFSALTNQAFVSAAARPGVHVRFDSETVIGPAASVMVTASVSGSGPEHEQRMEYRLAKRNHRWLITDVLVDGISSVDSYRDQVNRLMRKGGFAELIERMRSKLAHSRTYY